MKPAIAWPVVAIMMLGGIGPLFAADLTDQVRVEVASAEGHSGTPPGTYVCAAGHFHVKGMVQNLAGEPIGPVSVAGKLLDADGKVLGTATASTRQALLNPNDRAPVDLEFLTVTGPLIKQVKNQELAVVAVGPKP